MTTEIKYLTFKGIEKKEQILFKSFLNLAKNELEYQVVILKAGHGDDPDILILDESYDFDDPEKGLESKPTIMVGDDIGNDSDTYICRPVQWSDFKRALSQLNAQVIDDISGLIENEVETGDSLSETVFEFAINDETESVIVDRSTVTSVSVQKNYDFDLKNMTVEYNSFTSDEYEQVVDEVMNFNEGEEESPNTPVVLMADDESNSVSSVIIFETDSREAWDITLSEESSVNELDKADDLYDDDDDEFDEVILEQKVGLQMQPNEEYWLSDNEIIVDHDTLFYIKAKREMVYSAKEPGLWSKIIQGGELSKLPMSSDWLPKKGLNAYPMSCLHWVNALADNPEQLAPDLEDKSTFRLQKWPQFDLIELDNSLLKLCTMLFVRAETIESLMAKTGYSRGTIVGLINACNSIGILQVANDNEQENSISMLSTDGVFNKIKDVFR